jgi:hypothetical protein
MSTLPLDKISWDLFCPFPKVRATAEFTFSSKKYNSSERLPRIYSRPYKSAKYNGMELNSINIGTDAYITFTHFDRDYTAKSPYGKVTMTYLHLPTFLDGLDTTLSMVQDGCYEQKENGFILTPKGYDAVNIIENFIGAASLAFQPILLDNGNEHEPDDETGMPGIRIYLNGWEFFSDISLIDFSSFIMFYKQFNLFNLSVSAAQIAALQPNSNLSVNRTSATSPMRKK